jgi:hypothetical protein
MTDSEQSWAEFEHYQHMIRQQRTFRERLLSSDGLPPWEGYRRNRTARVAPA